MRGVSKIIGSLILIGAVLFFAPLLISSSFEILGDYAELITFFILASICLIAAKLTVEGL